MYLFSSIHHGFGGVSNHVHIEIIKQKSWASLKFPNPESLIMTIAAFELWPGLEKRPTPTLPIHAFGWQHTKVKSMKSNPHSKDSKIWPWMNLTTFNISRKMIDTFKIWQNMILWLLIVSLQMTWPCPNDIFAVLICYYFMQSVCLWNIYS